MCSRCSSDIPQSASIFIKPQCPKLDKLFLRGSYWYIMCFANSMCVYRSRYVVCLFHNSTALLCSARDPSPKQQPGFWLNVLCPSSWALISWSILLQLSLVFMPFLYIAKMTLSLELVFQPNFVSSVSVRLGWSNSQYRYRTCFVYTI